MSKKVIYLEDAITAVEIGAFSAATIYGRTDEGSTALHETVRAIKALPPAEPDSKDLIKKIKNGITVSDGNNEYFIGLRNGMRWCLSLIDDKEPLYENCPSAQPTPCEFCKHNNIADDKACLMCSAERRSE